MTSYTTHHGIPFPEGRDQVAVHTDIENAAIKTDAEIYNAFTLAREAITGVVPEAVVNLFDPENSVPGSLSSSGNVSDHVSNVVSEFIPVIGGQDYVSYNPHGPHRVVWFDHLQEAITGTDTTLQDTAETSVWTAPNNAAFLRIGVVRNSPDPLDEIIFNRGTTLWAPNKNIESGWWNGRELPRLQLSGRDIPDGAITPEKTTFFNVSSNLIDPDDISNGYVYAAGANIPHEHPYYSISGWITVSPGETYTLSEFFRISWFDESQQIVKSDNGFPDRWPQTFNAPNRAVWARVTIQEPYLQGVQMNQGATLLPFERGGVTLDPRYVTGTRATGGNMILIDSAGLGHTYTAPTIASQSELRSTTTAEVHGWYDTLLTAYPDYVTKTDLGMSSDDTNHVYGYTFSPPPPPTWIDGTTAEDPANPLPVVLIVAGLHGYERAPVYHSWRLAKALCEEWQGDQLLDALHWNTEIIIVPVGSPYGFDNDTRTNGNGVDLNRNFEEGWRLTVEGTDTYSGPEPLSEPETLGIYNLSQSVADRTVLGVDFHSFGPSPTEPQNVIWLSAQDDYTQNLGHKLISRMSRKWRSEHSWITNPSTYYGYASRSLPGGSAKQQMAAHGFPGATLEVASHHRLDGGEAAAYSSAAMTLGFDAFVNYIGMGTQAGIDLRNRN